MLTLQTTKTEAYNLLSEPGKSIEAFAKQRGANRWRLPGLVGGGGAMIVLGLGDLAVFPCNADKRPLVKAWKTAAKRIEPPSSWPLVGVPTGEFDGL